MASQSEPVLKLLLIGDQNVGKSSILSRYATSSFIPTYVPTIGIDFQMRVITTKDGRRVKLQIWDAAGQPRFRSITFSYYRGAQAILVVYAAHDRTTFESATREHMKDIERCSTENPRRFLISHTFEGRAAEVSQLEAQTWANAHNVTFFDVDAKSDRGLEDMFDQIASACPDKASFEPAVVVVEEKKGFLGNLFSSFKQAAAKHAATSGATTTTTSSAIISSSAGSPMVSSGTSYSQGSIETKAAVSGSSSSLSSASTPTPTPTLSSSSSSSSSLISLSTMSNASYLGALPVAPSSLPVHLHSLWNELAAEEAAERALIKRTADHKRADIIRRAIAATTATTADAALQSTTTPMQVSSLVDTLPVATDGPIAPGGM